MINFALGKPINFRLNRFGKSLRIQRWTGKKKPIEEMTLNDFSDSVLKKYEAEYNKLMYGDNDQELDRFLDKMGFSDMKNFEKMDVKDLERQFEQFMQRTSDLDSLELEQVAKGIMQDDPVMANYTSLIAKAASGEELTDQQKEYLHVIKLLEQRDVQDKYGDIEMVEDPNFNSESAKFAKVQGIEKDDPNTRW